MDYGALLKRAWNIVKENPYLFVLGLVVALTNGGLGSGNQYTISEEEANQFAGSSVVDQLEAWMGIAMAGIVGLICLFFILFLILWVAGQVARGGLIAGVDGIEKGQGFSLTDAWREGWRRKWTLLGISLVLGLPVIIMVLVGLAGLFLVFGATLAGGDRLSPALLFSGAAAGILAMICLFIPIALVLGLWSEFAFRAAMLEGGGVWASFGRGWRVLVANIGPVLVVVLIRIGAGMVLFLPVVVGSLCCLLWPILILLQGAVTTYFSTVWTLAWRDFTGVPGAPAVEMLEPVD